MRLLPPLKYIKTAGYNLSNYLHRDYIYPFYASYKITRICDRHCEFCNVWLERTHILTTDEVFRILDNLGNSSIFLLSFEGGEPLLRKDIADILEYVHTKPMYLLFTTAGEQFHRLDMVEYSKYIDFLHISIDEGHDNLYLLDRLLEFVKWHSILCVQIVVRAQDINALESKIEKCYRAKAKAVVMPACHIPNTENMMPQPDIFARTVLKLKKKYPNTIITTDKYLNTIGNNYTCTTASIIIDCDGKVFYPCRTLEEKVFDLLEEPLDMMISSKKANECREMMRKCNKMCHWYQYFATDSFTSPLNIFSSIRPYFSNFIRRKAEC